MIAEQHIVEPSVPDQPVCVNISTMEDNVLEATEMFMVSLNSSDPCVCVTEVGNSGGRTTVLIILHVCDNHEADALEEHQLKRTKSERSKLKHMQSGNSY